MRSLPVHVQTRWLSLPAGVDGALWKQRSEVGEFDFRGRTLAGPGIFADTYAKPFGRTVHIVLTDELPQRAGEYEFAGQPPRYLAFWRVARWSGDGGATTVLGDRPLYDALDEQEETLLRTTTCGQRRSEGLGSCGKGIPSRHPVFGARDAHKGVKVLGTSIGRGMDDVYRLPAAGVPWPAC